METTFVAVFPGLFLYSLDCQSVIGKWADDNKDKYDITIGDESPAGRYFTFSFTEPFVDIAYDGFKAKGEKEYANAKLLCFLFTQKYDCELSSIGYLTINVLIPDESNDIIKKMAKTEAKFQLYHVSKKLYESIIHVEKMNKTEFKLFYTYVGDEGLEGIRKKILVDIKKHLKEDFHNSRVRFELEKEKIGDFQYFPINILFKSKWEAFHEIMSHRFHVEKYSKNYMEREFLFLFERLMLSESKMALPIRTIKEGLVIYERIINGMDRIEDMYSFQLGITGTFFEVIGLTLAILTFFIGPESTIVSYIAIIILAGFSLGSLISLLFYSTGTMIKQELEYLIEEMYRT